MQLVYRRVNINGMTWFKLVSAKETSKERYLSFRELQMFYDAGIDLIDLDMILAEQARWN